MSPWALGNHAFLTFHKLTDKLINQNKIKIVQGATSPTCETWPTPNLEASPFSGIPQTILFAAHTLSRGRVFPTASAPYLSLWRCIGSQAAQAVAVPDGWFSRFKGEQCWNGAAAVTEAQFYDHKIYAFKLAALSQCNACLEIKCWTRHKNTVWLPLTSWPIVCGCQCSFEGNKLPNVAAVF